MAIKHYCMCMYNCAYGKKNVVLFVILMTMLRISMYSIPKYICLNLDLEFYAICMLGVIKKCISIFILTHRCCCPRYLAL